MPPNSKHCLALAFKCSKLRMYLSLLLLSWSLLFFDQFILSHCRRRCEPIYTMLALVESDGKVCEKEVQLGTGKLSDKYHMSMSDRACGLEEDPLSLSIFSQV